eukprot:CAMPEP_0198149204 /NCGR_PEP_ID=MMETSP1443-20131203/45369_1 /TAXON_ID=186043 /ORGANISM="Entomoneis sp., Strain CCMP2396" /LENGTH=235 /DNA_ID=CAMNT_0043814159 /DNA_START=90 /DNA_END=793 /DNA_ORIENTATION=+
MKFSVALACLLLPAAEAFTPSSSNVGSKTVLANDLFGGDDDGKGATKDMSKALPFVPRPKLLDGELAGDVGFDPFNFAGADKASLYYMREAEIKHSRLAMLAVAGWPLAELFDKPLADAAGLPTLLTKSGASPSILNGGLGNVDIAYWAVVVALAGIVEIESDKTREEKGKSYLLGDCNFDPLGFFPEDKVKRQAMMTKEIKHGRLAMMALTGFVVQEAIFRIPVVAETPFFFKP